MQSLFASLLSILFASRSAALETAAWGLQPVAALAQLHAAEDVNSEGLNMIAQENSEMRKMPMFGEMRKVPMFGEMRKAPMFGEMRKAPMFGEMRKLK